MGFAAAYVLNAFVATGVSPYAAIRPLLVAIAAASMLAILLWPLLGSARAGLITSGLVAFVALGRDVSMVGRNLWHALPTWQAIVVTGFAVAVIAVASLGAWRLWQRPYGPATWTTGCNRVVAVLLVLVGATGVMRGTFSLHDLDQGGSLQDQPDRSAVIRQGPDIYLILLDGYPRADTLALHFGYDDSPFLADLRQRGFEVASDSHSNYTLTQLTLTSLFHMSLLDGVNGLGTVLSGASSVQPTARRVLNDNPVFDFLRLHGYTTVSGASGYEDAVLRQSDVFMDLPMLNDFERHLLLSTFLLDALDFVAPNATADQRRAQIRSTIGNIEGLAGARTLGPRFAFIHVLLPHTPLLFGPNGEPLTGTRRGTEQTAKGLGLSDAEYAARVGGQVTYVNTQILDAVDALLRGAADEPVIILFSDHGPRTHAVDATTATSEDLRERFGTLFAALTPARTSVFPPNVTPAQSMAILFNAYFGTSFEMPADESFLSEEDRPFKFTRVPSPPAPPA